jgi:integrase
MARKQGDLTIKRIEKLGPGRHADGRGLYLQVINDNNKSWLYRFALDGRERWMGLGPLDTFNLDEARDRARKARQLVADGIDPLQAKQDERERRRAEASAAAAALAKHKTFEQVASEFFERHQSEWTNAKHAAQWIASLKRFAYPIIGKLFVSDIDTALIQKVLERDKLWATRRETARRTLGRIERVLNYAKASNYRSGDNPAAWSGHLKDLMPANGKTNGHHAALPYAELPAFMTDLRQREGTPARALEFTILTAARLSEVIGAVWEEIDWKSKTWIIPAARMKMDKEHRVPLTDYAVELLKALPTEDGNPHIFIGAPGKGLSQTRLFHLLRRIQSGITTHGFRSTFMDWAHEQTAFPKTVIDMALAHAVGDKVEAAYRRGDLFNKRKQLMQAWAAYCQSKPVEMDKSGTVVTLRSA